MVTTRIPVICAHYSQHGHTGSERQGTGRRNAPYRSLRIRLLHNLGIIPRAFPVTKVASRIYICATSALGRSFKHNPQLLPRARMGRSVASIHTCRWPRCNRTLHWVYNHQGKQEKGAESKVTDSMNVPVIYCYYVLFNPLPSFPFVPSLAAKLALSSWTLVHTISPQPTCHSHTGSPKPRMATRSEVLRLIVQHGQTDNER